MVYNKTKHPMGVESFQGYSSDRAPSLVAVAEGLVELNIARKNVLIYPPAHEQVLRSCQKAYLRFEQLLAQQSKITLSILKNTFSIDGQPLEDHGGILTELSSLFRQHQVVTVSFSRGLDKEELIVFLQLLSKDAQQVLSENAQPKRLDCVDLPHIQVQLVDYSRLQVTEEEIINRRAGQKSTESVWQRYVSALAPAAASDVPALMRDPVYLASIMNRYEIDIEKATLEYEAVIISELDSQFCGTRDTSSKETGLFFFNQLIHELNPELRQQFLAITFEQCRRRESESTTLHLMQGLGREVVFEMLRYAKADAREISPSLVALIQKIGHLPGTLDGNSADPAGAQASLSSDTVQKLLNRETYEHYVDEQYDQLLKHAAVNDENYVDLNGLVLDLETGLDDHKIDSHTGRALMRLMAISADAAAYRDWARQLSLLLEDLVRSQSFACLGQIWDFIQDEFHNQQDDEMKKIAGLVLNSLTNPGFVALVMKRIENADDKFAQSAMALLPRLGETAVLEILDSMDGAESDSAMIAKMRLLEPVGHTAAVEALRRLNDDQPGYVCTMLRIVRVFGNAEMAESVRLLIDNEDPCVAREALATLLRHGNPWGILRLRDIAATPWSPEVEKAVQMAGEFGVKEIVPTLAAYVNRRGSLAADMDRRQACLRALGKIGDTTCIPVLEKLAAKKRPFGGKHLIQLKRTLFESLAGYPFKSVGPLIHAGLKLKDDHIVQTCRRLLTEFYAARAHAEKQKANK